MSAEIISYDPRAVAPCRGLPNIGNTCYLNSLLQCIMSCSSFNQVILRVAHKNPIAAHFKELLRHGDESAAAISRINTAVVNQSPLRRGAQEDVQEAFLFLIKALAEPSVTRLFKFRIKKIIHCIECKTIIKDENVEEVCFNISPVDIGDASLNTFLTRSTDSADGHYCAKCARKTKKRINNLLLMVPEILCIYIPQIPGQQKKSINISKNLLFMTAESLGFDRAAKHDYMHYALVGAAAHHGHSSFDSGHYTADVMRASRVWHCNDSTVSIIKDFNILSSSYNLLFYHYMGIINK
jgi:ubiquitin carboxyl-terminal hydrolase 36/42